MTVDECVLKVIEIVEVLCGSSVPDTGVAFDQVASELRPLLLTESERAAAVARNITQGETGMHYGEETAKKILRTSPGKGGCVMGLEWSHNPPVADGFYLRVNAGHRIQRHTVADGYIDWGWSNETKALSVSHPKIRDPRWWWVGPIPYPPKETGIAAFRWPECIREDWHPSTQQETAGSPDELAD